MRVILIFKNIGLFSLALTFARSIMIIELLTQFR